MKKTLLSFLLILFPMIAVAQSEQDLWARAVSAMEVRDAERALPDLERLVSDYPGNAVYRLELGYALYQLGKLGRARYHIDRASIGRLADSQRDAARILMRRIDEQRRWTGYFQINFQPESNPGRQTTASTVDIGGGTFVLNDDARATPSTSVIVATGLSFTHKVSDAISLRAHADVWARWNEDERLRDDVLTLRFGPQFTTAKGARLEFGPSVGRSWNANEPQTERFGFYGSFGQPIGQKSYVSASISRVWSDMIDGSSDEIDDALRLSFARAVTDRTVLRLSAAYRRKDIDIPSAAWTERSVGVGANSVRPGGWQLRSDLTATRRNYDGPDRIFGVVRQDDIVRLDFGVSDRDLRIGPFVPELRMGLERGTSNISMNSYQNRYMTVTLTRQF